MQDSEKTLAHAVLSDWIYTNSYSFREFEFAEIITTPDSLIGGYIKQFADQDDFQAFVVKYSFNEFKAQELLKKMSHTATTIRISTIEDQEWYVNHQKWEAMEEEFENDEEYNYIEEICKILEF